MAIVYEAEQKGADDFVKRVAVKLLREDYSKIDEFRSNFLGEARLVADLIHTNIVRTYHLGEISGQYFMTMEYVDGITLEDFTQRHRASNQLVPTDLATFIVSYICRSLSHARQRCDQSGRSLGIVHRDVNPRNIMIGREGDVKLIDFGIAKALDLMYNEEGPAIAGKDNYLSPEQASREVTDVRADLFCYTILLSEMLVGESIFESNREKTTHKDILELSIPDFMELRPEIDPQLDDILQRGFKRVREERDQSEQAILAALEMFLHDDDYGPTNKKLAAYMSDLPRENSETASERWHQGRTPGPSVD
jgi:serine/threonine-protein kinase